MSITLTNAEIREILRGQPGEALMRSLERALTAGNRAATRKAANGAAPKGKGHALCVAHATMPDGIASLTGKWLCWAQRSPTDREVEARRKFVAEVERSALAARKRWANRPAPDGKLAWLDGKRIKPSGLLAARANIVKAREAASKYAPTGVQPGDCFDTLRPVRPRGYKPGVAGHRSVLAPGVKRRRSRKAVIRVTARA